MRFFPSASRQRLAAATLAGAVALGALSAPTQLTLVGDDLKEQQRKVQKRIAGAAEDLEHSSARARRAMAAAAAARAELDTAQGRLGRVRERLDAARQRDERMAAKLVVAEQRLETAREQLEAGQEALKDQRRVVRDRVADSYMQGSPELATISSLLRTRSTQDLTRQQAATGAILGRETTMYDELQAAEVLLQLREDEVREATRLVERDRKRAAHQLETIRRLASQALSARDEVRALAAKRVQTRRDAYAVKMRDQKALAALRRQEARIRARIAAAARAARGTSVTARATGYLTRPSSGYVTSPFGMRTHPIYGYRGLHDGTDFGAPCGTPLIAAGSGKVISRYYSSSYGHRLFLYLGQVNGRSLTVVYNHAQGYRYGVGDSVNRGAVVGSLGSTGWSTGCHLHFSVLVNGNPVDPMNWL